HTYPGSGSYIISMEDPNRNGGVINMDESISQVFYIEALLKITPFGGHNNSVRLLYPAKDQACVNRRWEHNPGAFDIDGDSLVYSLVPCRGFQGEVINSWDSPNLIEESNGVEDQFVINSETGTVTWNSPVVAGEYNIAIKIDEYRAGFLVGYVIRDMQIEVQTCANQEPPVLTLFTDTCIVIGETLTLEVIGTDDASSVELSATGAPLTEVTNQASFFGFFGNPALGTFNWTPDCEEVRPAAYQVLFIGKDTGGEPELVDISEVSITVIAPEVENLTVDPNGLSFDLEWEAHFCAEVIAYKIYRRTGFFGYEPLHCETGVPEYTGYDLIATIAANQTVYNDSQEIGFGIESCYMIVAYFANGSESIASDEVCNSIDLLTPVITKASVGVTNLNSGVDTLNWAPPVSGDTLLLSSPFKYNVYHDIGNTSAETLILETPTSEFISLLPRIFIHENINTQEDQHAYRVEIEDALGNRLSSRVSSSLFLTITPNDNELSLNWQSNTSWQNTSFEVFKLNEETNVFDFLDVTAESFYTDTGLVNNVDYCYYVKALGTFNSELDVLPSPTINFSQEVCGAPVDLTSPCSPDLSGEADCENGTVNLIWNNPNESCSDDVTSYNIYYKPYLDAEYDLLETISSADQTTFVYVNENNITGCFYVSALDSILPGLGGIPNQNESIASLEICSENCPEYSLPNVFSPQGDSYNDLFQPFPYAYVDSIDMTIFNRWGTKVFKTTDPDIKWAGLNINTNEISSDGVYFYEVTIYTSMLSGVIEEKRSGTIVLFDGEKQPTE
ncbi:MAG: gliding motility-associated-like protein, partial [Saprospiraceae bacterium]